jgi:hypothetical protein
MGTLRKEAVTEPSTANVIPSPEGGEPATRLIAWVVSLNPFLRYAVVPVAVAAGLSLITNAFAVSHSTTVIASLVAAAFAVFFFLVSRVVAAGNKETRRPVLILLWFFTIVFMLAVLGILVGVGVVLMREYVLPRAAASQVPSKAPPPEPNLVPLPTPPTVPPPTVPPECDCSEPECARALEAALRPARPLRVAIDADGYVHQNGKVVLLPKCQACRGCTVSVNGLQRACCYRTGSGQVRGPCSRFQRVPWSAASAGSAEQCAAGVCVCEDGS